MCFGLGLTNSVGREGGRRKNKKEKKGRTCDGFKQKAPNFGPVIQINPHGPPKTTPSRDSSKIQTTPTFRYPRIVPVLFQSLAHSGVKMKYLVTINRVMSCIVLPLKNFLMIWAAGVTSLRWLVFLSLLCSSFLFYPFLFLYILRLQKFVI